MSFVVQKDLIEICSHIFRLAQMKFCIAMEVHSTRMKDQSVKREGRTELPHPPLKGGLLDYRYDEMDHPSRLEHHRLPKKVNFFMESMG